MHEQVHLDAVRLESLLPTVMRVLFRHDGDEPLVELSVAQMRMMRLLYARDRMPGEVSTELGLTPSAVTQIANRLEKSGLIERRSDPTDRRVRLIGLSEDGRQKMRQRQAYRVSRAEGVLVALSDAHRRALVEALEDLVEAAPTIAAPDPIALVAELEQALPTVPPYDDRNDR